MVRCVGAQVARFGGQLYVGPAVHLGGLPPGALSHRIHRLGPAQRGDHRRVGPHSLALRGRWEQGGNDAASRRRRGGKEALVLQTHVYFFLTLALAFETGTYFKLGIE